MQGSDGNVGIGTSSISSWAKLQVAGTAGAQTGAAQALYLTSPSTTANEGVGIRMSAASGSHEAVGIIGMVNNASGNSGSMTFHTYNGGADIPERMRIDSSGNLLVGKTAVGISNAGFEAVPAGTVSITRADTTLQLNRLSSDGALAVFYKDGSEHGRITVQSAKMGIGTGDTGIVFNAATNGVLPFNPGTNQQIDNTLDLGHISVRWDDIYATNGTIQTSDRNEKQDIEALSDAEQRVAVAAKGLLRKFRWIDAVEAKGDDARIHFGIIAQDLQAAFEAEGLDAARYAMFTSNTWWESQTEVAAVEATEDTEAVDAYTRTDTYDTAEEAPEGATERTRLGVRYSELLAFIIAAI